MGYLSQVVQDARPRAAPSLYAHAPAQPAGASEPLSYARLMESSPAPSTDGQSTGVQQPVAADISPSNAEELPQEEGATPQHNPSAQPPCSKRAAASNPTKPHVETRTPANLQVTAPSSFDAHAQETPATPPKPISGTTPRPVSFDVPSSAPQDVRHISAQPLSAQKTSRPTDTGQFAAEPKPFAEQAQSAQRISSRVAVAGQPTAHSIAASAPLTGEMPPAKPVHPSAPTAFGAPAATRQTPATEVHIGEVEIIVQDPPTPPRQPAHRPATAAPSPARYHIRRL